MATAPASLAIERNASYLHQFIHRGTPKVLTESSHAGRVRSLRPRVPTRFRGATGARNDKFEEAADAWLFADPLIRHEFRTRPEDLRIITVDGTRWSRCSQADTASSLT